MGQCALQAGVEATRINNRHTLRSIGFRDSEFMDADAPEIERRWVDVAYLLNDDDDMDDCQREKELTELAAENGIELVFIN